MTKEDLIFELKKRCSFWLNNKTISKKHALENLLGILENEESQPSIPYNDEAADAYIRRVADAGWEWTTQDIAEAFKAGAELIAGQYEKIEGELVDWYSTSDGKDYCCGVRTMDAFEVPEGFYIRKKQPGESLKEKEDDTRK